MAPGRTETGQWQGGQLHRPFCSIFPVSKFCVEKYCAVLAEGQGPGEQVKQSISRKSDRKLSTTAGNIRYIHSFIHSFILSFIHPFAVFSTPRSKSAFSGFSCSLSTRQTNRSCRTIPLRRIRGGDKACDKGARNTTCK